MSARELRHEDVNAALAGEHVLSAHATDIGIDLFLSNGQRIQAVATYEGMCYYLVVDADEEDPDLGGDSDA